MHGWVELEVAAGLRLGAGLSGDVTLTRPSKCNVQADQLVHI